MVETASIIVALEDNPQNLECLWDVPSLPAVVQPVSWTVYISASELMDGLQSYINIS